MKKGFTLIELLIVIAIIGLLATLAIVSLTTAQRKARDTKRVSDMKSIQTAVELYYSDNTAYPTPADWAALTTSLSPYLTQVPVAPGHTSTSEQYVYGNCSVGTGCTTTKEYFVGATMEDSGHQALSQDDDASYAAVTVVGSEWVGETTVGFVASTGSVTAFDCADPKYCLSE